MEKTQKIKSVAEEVFEKIEKEQAMWDSLNDIERDRIVRYKVNRTLALQKEGEGIKNSEIDYREEKSAFIKFIETHTILTQIVFWGLWVLLIWWLMARNDNRPDFNALQPLDIEECTGLSGDAIPC
mgnify:FL=1